MKCPNYIHGNEKGRYSNNRYNANTFQSIRGRTVGDGLTAADILINIIIMPILNNVRNLRDFMSNVLEFSPTQIDKLTTSMGSMDRDIFPLQTSQYIEYNTCRRSYQLADNLYSESQY
jgi:hypothetical protein